MLEISEIKKDYEMKDQVVEALKGINICFRRSEFVSILGPSGCGKTTLLNIIGGLDRYTSGDLIIDGVSTKEFKDKDWDNYRNHRVGFVFQNYNLIPHQTILENVELALTLSGIKKAERRARAIEVLEKVGLGDKLKSKPNQLSGGQMQRVAIARALVNDPEIILADEPTGALDSKTSVQIMELLKEVSQDRLVIMVTHNPDLANEYSSRIIRLLDGELIEDSMPYTQKEANKEIAKHKKEVEENKNNQTFKKTEKKKSMSFFTALSLSFKNLLTKKGRTTMVAFAGSIGIIGIALILAVSSGMTSYINRMQSESLSSYPISVAAVALDIENIQQTLTNGNVQQETAEDEIGVYDMTETLVNMGRYNYMSKDFISYVEDYYSKVDKKDLMNEVNISYATDMRLITDFSTDLPYMPINNTITASAFSGTTSSIFFEGLNNEEYVRSMYDVYGTYPTEKNQIALVLSGDSLSTLELMGMGINVEKNNEGKYPNIKFEDLIGKKSYKLILNDAYYQTGTETPVLDFNNLSTPQAMAMSQPALEVLHGLTNGVEELTISCVLKLKDDASGSIFSSGLMYTKALSEFYRNNCKQSNVVNVLKTKYLNAEGNFTNEEVEFENYYSVRISELETYLSVDNGIYTYKTPKSMKQTLFDHFGIALSDEEVIDLYLQVYGASDVPTGMYFYVKSFDAKDDLISMLDSWNAKDGVYKIYHTDSTGMLTNMLGSLVDIISYVLIAFAAISLVVSSLMIGIITYTSVIERTKEIGVLRSVGASKRDVSRVFNAETTIIGLFAGVLGIAVSGLLTIPIAFLLKKLTGIAGLAVMQPVSSIILIVISVVLTFIAGLIPARIAAKKDPVLALRSE